VLTAQQSSKPVPAISFQLIDQGCGIPEKEIAAVFEPFYESTRTHNGAGASGLGLPLSRAIILRHQGTISLRNNPAIGITREVILPCVAVDDSTPGKSENAALFLTENPHLGQPNAVRQAD